MPGVVGDPPPASGMGGSRKPGSLGVRKHLFLTSFWAGEGGHSYGWLLKSPIPFLPVERMLLP